MARRWAGRTPGRRARRTAHRRRGPRLRPARAGRRIRRDAHERDRTRRGGAVHGGAVRRARAPAPPLAPDRHGTGAARAARGARDSARPSRRARARRRRVHDILAPRRARLARRARRHTGAPVPRDSRPRDRRAERLRDHRLLTQPGLPPTDRGASRRAARRLGRRARGRRTALAVAPRSQPRVREHAARKRRGARVVRVVRVPRASGGARSNGPLVVNRRARLGALITVFTAIVASAGVAVPARAQTSTSATTLTLVGQDPSTPLGGTATLLLQTSGPVDGLSLVLTVHD